MTVLKHPGCDYATAYHACFHDIAKNNDDIVRNYINRFSKVLSFSKDGTLSTTDINAKQIFSFMDRNNKKEFFDTFSLENEKCLMDSYLEKDIEEKKQMFYEYLKSTGLAESSCKQYAFTHPFHEEVINIVQEVAHKNSLFDVIDGWQVKNIHKQVCALEGNKKQGSAWSATVSNYKNFLDYLEVGVSSEEVKKNVQNEIGAYPETDYVKFKHLLEYFCAHLQYVVTNDKNTLGYEEYLKKYVDSGSFKKAGQGYKGDNIQKQIANWEQLSEGRICISVYGSSYKGLATYLHWDSTPHNVIANWKGNDILTLQLLDYNDSTKEREPLNVKFSLKELGLYDGKGTNTNIKVFFDEFAKLLKKETKAFSIDDCPEENAVSEPLTFTSSHPRQIIYYGAPGTGKSHTIKKEEDEGKITCIRTTFHPDSDYATFVGCYKPHKDKESKELTYEFVEQAFLSAYKQAWMNPDKEIALVIEEINRGNCAQVFGDIFQLLDRDEDGWSTYPIKADTDIAEHLAESHIQAYAETMKDRFGKDKEGNEKYPDRNWFEFMALPPNMSILATMNTSDQSLFPIDSAFKRRWDWKYIKIKEGKENGVALGWNIQIEDEAGNAVKIIGEKTKLSWWEFIKKVNEIIASMTSSADKQLGYFFCKPTKKENETDEKPTIITADTLVGKVMFYLWNDVFKDYGFEDASLFTYTSKDENGKEMVRDLAFADFYDEEGEHVDTVRLVDFLNRVMTWQNNKDSNE